MRGTKKAGNLVEGKVAARYVMNTGKTTTPAVAAGGLKPKDWRRNEGGRWRRDMQTRQGLWLAVVGIGGKGKPLLNRTSSAADPQMTMGSRKGYALYHRNLTRS